MTAPDGQAPALVTLAERAVLHVDMDAFFASIAVRDDPSLRGKPVLVGGAGPRGVVSAASYEARKYGCHSAMPMSQAKRLCPNAILAPVPRDTIRAASAKVFETLERFSPVIEPLSVDEAFLDLTGSQRLLGEPRAVAAEVKRAVREATRLIASVGLAPNRFLAKVASDLDKPDGLCVIDAVDVPALLGPLDVSRIPGVGPAARDKLRTIGIRTCADLAKHPLSSLERTFGDWGVKLHHRAHGRESRPVDPARPEKSVGHERTFDRNLNSQDDALAALQRLAEDVGRRLRSKGRLAKGVTLKLRFDDFRTITRSTTLDRPTDLTDDLLAAARGLFRAWAGRGFEPVRLIGVTAAPLAEYEPPAELFPDPRRAKRAELDKTLDGIAARFGKDAVRRAPGIPTAPGAPKPARPASPETRA
ncbi:MAG: DNA polymerase IV [Planctomycetota bacterium]